MRPHEATLQDMSEVGLRELKNQLSKYVKRARSGETVSITDRGEVVAELVPPDKLRRNGLPTTSLDELRRKGILYGDGKNAAGLYPAMPRALKHGTSSELLDEVRGDR
jgi:prevent-host-death family protein